ncbi:MAG: DUF2087 domain-containing protein [Reichenbachiella sp.]
MGGTIVKYLDECTVDELVVGVKAGRNGTQYSCIICGEQFQKGVIYPHGSLLLDAQKAAETHIHVEHGGMFKSLLNMGKEVTGLSEIQALVIEQMFSSATDKEIAYKLGGKTESTVRNHRFNLKKKKREAKMFLALMDILDSHDSNDMEYLQFHSDIPTKDDRTVVTGKEAQKMYSKYFDTQEPFKLLSFPKKQKIKLVILQRISQLFKKDIEYSEIEVNELLMPVYEDYTQIRRYMVDYAFLLRNSDGSVYTLNETVVES